MSTADFIERALLTDRRNAAAVLDEIKPRLKAQGCVWFRMHTASDASGYPVFIVEGWKVRPPLDGEGPLPEPQP
jgi:hypothetical protein